MRSVLVGWRATAAVVAVTVLLAGGLLALSRSSLFRLRHLEVAGAGHLTRGELVALAGLTRQTNVLWADLSAAERRIASNPWVAEVAVVRALPWTVKIAIVERTPVAVIRDEDRSLLLAGDGTVLGAASPEYDLPLVSLPRGDALEGGPAPSVAGAVRALAALPPAIRAAVVGVEVGTDGTVELRIAGGPVVAYGAPVAVADKAEVLAEVLVWARGEKGELLRVDLSSPSAPSVTFSA